jgi:cysteinyl-tRNA synthetase
MEQARAQLDTFKNALLAEPSGDGEWDELATALDDDFNTPEALAVFHRWRAAGANEELRRGLELFGISPPSYDAPNEIRELAEARQAARGDRDFGRADELRAEIEEHGWEVRDVEGGYQLVPK